VGPAETTAALTEVAQSLIEAGSAEGSARSGPRPRATTASARIGGRVMKCGLAGTGKCAVADGANVLLLNSKLMVIARNDALHGVYRFAVTPGRYGLIALPPAYHGVHPRPGQVHWVSVGAEVRAGVTLVVRP